MKVRESKIPEDNGAPEYFKEGQKVVTNVDDLMFGDDDEPKRLKKTMINFKEEGIVISAYDLNSIEKDMRFVAKPKAHWEYGITINKGLTPGQFAKKIDLSMWYIKEEIRDKKWNKLLSLLKEEGLNVIDIE